MSNTIFAAAVDGSMTLVRSKRYAEWYEKYEALQGSFEGDRELMSDFYSVIWEGINLHADEMFRLGWELRGDPSKLFDLPDGE